MIHDAGVLVRRQDLVGMFESGPGNQVTSPDSKNVFQYWPLIGASSYVLQIISTSVSRKQPLRYDALSIRNRSLGFLNASRTVVQLTIHTIVNLTQRATQTSRSIVKRNCKASFRD
jgi:hypothetical protein